MPSHAYAQLCGGLAVSISSWLRAGCAGLAGHERLHLIAGMVNLTHAQQLSALGALLSILQEVCIS